MGRRYLAAVAVILAAITSGCGSDKRGAEGKNNRARLQARSKEPSAGRIDGRWHIVQRPVGGEAVKTFRDASLFRPRCAAGPCSVRAGGIGTFRYDKAIGDYELVGSQTDTDCIDRATNTVLKRDAYVDHYRYTLQVQKARQLKGQWRAIRLTGELVSRVSALPGTPASCGRGNTQRYEITAVREEG